MTKAIARAILFLAAIEAAALASGQTLTVTSPTSGQFLGQSNTLRFNVTGANVQVTITATITGPGGVTQVSGQFDPTGQPPSIDGTLALNFNEASPTGPYVIVVEGKRNDNQVVFGTVTINVTVDVQKPKFLQFNPIEDSFVRGSVLVRATVNEPFFKDYRVQVNNQDIPNNTGTTLIGGGFTVIWDTSGIQFDGPQSIGIRLRDEALNEENKTISVVLDRIAPVVAISQPMADVRLRPRSTVSVIVDIGDAADNSVSVTGVDVVARRLDGSFLSRVARQSFRGVSANTMRWTGRLRWRSSLPKEFKLVVSVRDRAGNVSSDQEVIVRYR